MKKHIPFLSALCLLFLITSVVPAKAQRFISKDYDKVLKDLKKYNPGNDSTTVSFSSTENSIKMAVGGTGSQSVNFEYSFDANKKCISEKVIANCDSCYKKYLNELLSKKKYGWVRLNENQYISAYKWQLMIELPVSEEKTLFYNLLKVEWSEETYAILFEGAQR